MLAIIIPYYKLTFFEATLQSLAYQTDKRFKVYIGDDASPEDCTVLLEKFQGQFDFVYHRFESNLGGISLTQQWERCIALSGDEEWLMILGDDDVLGENVVEEFYELVKKNNEKDLDLIRFRLRVIDKVGNVYSDSFDYDIWESSERLLERMFSLRETITASEFVFKRELYNLNKGFVDFPLAWFSDYATWLLYGKKSGIHNVSNADVFWRLSRLNISSNKTSKGICIQKISALFLFLDFLKCNFSKIKRGQLLKFGKVHLMNLLVNFRFSETVEIFSGVLKKSKSRIGFFLIIDYVKSKIFKKIQKGL